MSTSINQSFGHKIFKIHLKKLFPHTFQQYAAESDAFQLVNFQGVKKGLVTDSFVAFNNTNRIITEVIRINAEGNKNL